LPLKDATRARRAPTAEIAESASRFDAILDSAEQVFATSGYAGATMREIAETANVAQGLIHYHFDNKETLFEKMIGRRTGEINEKRASLLKKLFQSKDQPELVDVVDTLFRPSIENGMEKNRDGGAFARILVACYASPEPRIQKLVEKNYNPIARRFIDALMKVEPKLTHADAVWAYMFAISVGTTMMAKTGRSVRLSDGECDDGDSEELLKRIVPFVCGGIRALL
jgi:AcrR family transcriptional regulator